MAHLGRYFPESGEFLKRVEAEVTKGWWQPPAPPKEEKGLSRNAKIAIGVVVGGVVLGTIAAAVMAGRGASA